jgi:hypothetical protein
MSLLRTSRLASALSKLAWAPTSLGGKVLKGLWNNKMLVGGTALTAGVTGAGVNQALDRSRAGATPEWVAYSRNRGVPAAPQF